MTALPNSNSEPVSQGYGKLDDRIRRWIWEAKWTALRNVQEQAIPPILAGDRDVIIAASTASGKTEAAFFPILTRLAEPTEDPKLVIYIGPLKALINDQWLRLEGLCETLEIPVTPWHGDIAAIRKQKFLKHPSGCLLITPESMEAMLMRQGSTVAGIFRNLSYVVIDELHSFMGSERGKQLQSQLTRVEKLIGRRVCRIGLSATLGNMEGAKEFLRPGLGSQCHLISVTDHNQELRVLIKGVLEPQVRKETTSGQEKKDGENEDETEPALIAMASIVGDLYKNLRGSNNLIFPNSRSAVEFFADRLRKKSEQEMVPNEFWPHHGNLSKEIREQTEAALKKKEVPASAICTSTLELGIDIGSVKCVAQIGSPPSVASLRQRLGRSGRRQGEPAILRGYAIERQLSIKSSPHELLRAELVQIIAMVRLLVAGWYEPVEVNGLHASTLVQQILSVITQNGGATAGQLWETLCRSGAFHGMPQELFVSLLRGLKAKDILNQDANGLILPTEKGERITGHYTFYAAFATQEEFRVIAGGRTLGSMPITRPLVAGGFLIFAGRRWLVVAVSQEELVIEVKPGGGGALPSFDGLSTAVIHDRVREEMRTVLQASDPVSFLDATATKLLDEARENYIRLDLETHWVRQSGADVHLFTWKGDRINDTLALIFQAKSLMAMNHGVYVEVTGIDRNNLLAVCMDLLDGPALDAVEIASDVENKFREKWDEVLSGEVLDASFASSHIDLSGAMALLRTVKLSS